MKRRAPAHSLLLLLILLLAAALRFAYLDRQSLWNDEGTSVAMAQRDLRSIARDAAADIHPPLYYVLLNRWVRALGTSEAAVRSLSALLGLGLVALTYALGRLLLGRGPGLAAALLSAVSPFQVYYSQEARMYMLLAVLAAGAVLALVRWVRSPSWLALGTLALLEAAGLYTHYSFLFIVLALNLAFLCSLRRGTLRRLAPWAASQAAAGLLYLPWLPVALRQGGSWPSPAKGAFWPALADAWRWLVFGPAIDTRTVWPVLLLAALLALAGLVLLCLGLPALPRTQGGGEGAAPASVSTAGETAAKGPRRWPAAVLLLWIGLPLGLVFALGLYREAYLKFLLVSSPAVCLLLAAALTWPWERPVPARRAAPLRAVQLLLLVAVLVVSGSALLNYWFSPSYARDDYRSIAAYVDALGRPGDAVLLNAPGQQEVFGYYYRGGLPVHPLPEGRPLDPAATESALAGMAAPGGRIFAVLWGSDESDPGRFIEGWLDGHTYKALDAWYGNVRLAVYAVPAQTAAEPAKRLGVTLADASSGDEIALLGYSLLNGQLDAGDIAQISLFWQAGRTPTRRYKVFLHVLDEANHIVGQHDSEPGGGSLLTTLWPAGRVIADHMGVAIHPATPPGRYRVEVGLYDAETGGRLAAPDGATQVWLDPLQVERPPAAAPAATLGLQQAEGADWGALRLLSYDTYRLGASPGSREPLRAGHLLHADLYWQADEAPAGDWSLQADLLGEDGSVLGSLSAALAVAYPTGLWQAGDVWRGQLDLPIPAGASPGRCRLRILPLAPGGASGQPFLSKPLQIEAAP